MKNPKNLTKKQKIFLTSKKLNYENWKVIKDTPIQMEIINSITGKIKKIYKERR